MVENDFPERPNNIFVHCTVMPARITGIQAAWMLPGHTIPGT